jgi:hypothetical protein
MEVELNVAYFRAGCTDEVSIILSASSSAAQSYRQFARICGFGVILTGRIPGPLFLLL